MIYNYRNQMKGFSLAEVSIAMLVSASVVFAASHWFIAFNKRNKEVTIDQDLKVEIDFGLTNLDKLIQNSARLFPNEDLYSLDDGLYSGIHGLDRGISGCRYQRDTGNKERFSIVRFSTIKSLRAERTLRLWSDTNTLVVNPNNDIRVSYRNDSKYVLQASVNTPEIVILDADGEFAQRYRVSNYRVVSTFNDPYTDLPTNPRTRQTYTVATLAMPRRVGGAVQDTKNVQFVTGSLVTASQTNHVCVSSNTGRLIIIDQANNTIKELLNPESNNFRITRFEVGYLNLRDNTVVDTNLAQRFPTDDTAACVNAAVIKIELTSVTDSTKIKTTTRTISLNNFSIRRPPSCL